MMARVQQYHCPGCNACPLIAVSDPTPKDSINFIQMVNCMREERLEQKGLMSKSGRLSEEAPWRQGLLHQHQYFNQELTEDVLREAVAKKQPTPLQARERVDREEAGRTLTSLTLKHPDAAPVINRFMSHYGDRLNTNDLQAITRLVSEILATQSREAFAAKVKKANAELLDLCQRLIRSFEHADDLEDIRSAVEELDSLLYEVEIRTDDK